MRSSLRSFCLEMLIQVSAFLVALKSLETISLHGFHGGHDVLMASLALFLGVGRGGVLHGGLR